MPLKAKSSGSTITLNGKTYAVGLFWQPLQSANDPLQEIKEAAHTIISGADVYCLRKGSSPQYGLGFSSEGHKSGMSVIATGIADAFSDKNSFVAVFKVDEGWWFIAARNDLILSEEEKLYGNENDAKKAFSAMMSVPDWGYKIAPAAWGIEGTKEVALSEIITHTKPLKLSALSKKISPVMLLLFLTLFGIGGWYGYQYLQEEEAVKKAATKAQKEMEYQLEEATKAPPPPPLEKPWEKMINPQNFAQTCFNALTQFYTIIPGWRLEEVKCLPQKITGKWKREEGTVLWMTKSKESFDELAPIQVSIHPSGETATGNLKFGPLTANQQNPNLILSEINYLLNDLFQSLNIEAIINIEHGNLAQIKQQQEQRSKWRKTQTLSPVFPHIKITFDSPLPPQEWAKLFSPISALEFNSFLWDNIKETWKYEGKIYGK